MAFLASTQIPADSYSDAKRIANRIRAKAAEWIGWLSVGLDADQAWSMYREIHATDSQLSAIAAVPGISEYAAAQENVAGYDVAAEFDGMMTAIVTAGSWIYSALPRDVSGYLLTHTTTEAGELVPRTFSAQDVTPLVPLLQAVVDSIA